MHESEVSEIVTHTIDMMNALSVRQFSLPPNTYIGAGAIARTGEAIEKCGVRRVLGQRIPLGTVRALALPAVRDRTAGLADKSLLRLCHCPAIMLKRPPTSSLPSARGSSASTALSTAGSAKLSSM